MGGAPTPAGWFTSTDSDGMQRWWDGAGWTSLTRPVPAPVDHPGQHADSPPPARSTPTDPGVQPYGSPAFGTPVPASPYVYEVTDGRGPSVTWRAEPIPGGTEPSDRLVIHRRRRTRMGPVGQLLLGLTLLAFGLLVAGMITDENTTHGDESTVTATVVDHEVRVDSHGDQICSPVVSFFVGGTTYTAEAHSATSDCPVIGSSVTVIYTTAAPGDGDARVKSTSLLNWLLWLMPFSGVVIVIAATRRFGVVRRAVGALFPSRAP
ncbi:DUF2510 domain-containing protein [Cellulomonas sp. URHD0024]|uniref:DUF2510 domain-containing protein n=1 Tax=Cellulomonas sp. URHD0024 TaxID=1302620 RepID=UPI00040CF047|nr:DUF2510 domain-containing protein [Cellulomonas sp. URHD0024]